MKKLFKEVSDYQEYVCPELAAEYRYLVYTYWHRMVSVKSRKRYIALIAKQICRLDRLIDIRPFLKLLLKI